jgi:hypothetical protein
MGIIATVAKQKSYLKIEKFWGSVAEGFTAWVAVYDKKDGEKDDKKSFAIRAPYNEKPFESIYEVLKQDVRLSDVQEEDGTVVARTVVAEAVVEVPTEEVVAEPAKKTRCKKK